MWKPLGQAIPALQVREEKLKAAMTEDLSSAKLLHIRMRCQRRKTCDGKHVDNEVLSEISSTDILSAEVDQLILSVDICGAQDDWTHNSWMMTKHDYINIINPLVFLWFTKNLEPWRWLCWSVTMAWNHQDLYVTDEVYRLVAKGKAFREAAGEKQK